MSRGEWEDALAENQPDPNAAQSGRHLPRSTVGDLRPLFVTDVTRTAIDIEPVARTRVEAAIDEGEIRPANGAASEPISEIELELRVGEPAALYDLALQLSGAAPVRPETRPKAERGYRLAAGESATPAVFHAEPVGLDPGMAAAAALQAIGRNCLVQLMRNEPAVLAAEPEGVHQMRVALRRFRSAVSSLKNILAPDDRCWLQEELGWLARAFGAARNLDVFATELLPSARAGLADRPGWEELGTALDRLRTCAYDRVREVILSDRYTTAMLRLLRWLEAGGRTSRDASIPAAPPVAELAPHILDRRLRKVRRRSKGFSGLSQPQRHKLRIATKKLRYTVEVFGNLYDHQALSPFARTLRRLQDDLGYANDVRVAHEFVPELFAHVKPGSPAIRAWIDVLEWHDQILAGRERKLRKHLRRLNDSSPFWQV